jgi:hypothetical protein
MLPLGNSDDLVTYKEREMTLNFSVQWLPVLVCALIPMIAGMLWYSPLLFAEPWMRSMGINMSDVKESGLSSSRAYAASTFASLILSLVMGVIVLSTNTSGFLGGVVLGFIVWLGFNFTSVFKYIFFEDRPWSLFLIDAGYDIACFTLIGGVLAVWR